MNVVQVHGIRTYSYHGCLKEEKVIGGNYIVDVDVFCDFRSAALEDNLTKTVDYVDVKNIVVHEMGLPFKLIETVAYNIITQLKAKFSTVEKCMVKIKKINPPIDGDVNYVSVIVKE